MSINLYLDNIGGNTIAALADGKRLVEYHIERSSANQIVGNIYKGKVEVVLSGMQAAFINVGLQKNGYLFVGDTLIDKSLLSDGNFVNFNGKRYASDKKYERRLRSIRNTLLRTYPCLSNDINPENYISQNII
jgi:Rne/Rng family ribonuclease